LPYFGNMGHCSGRINTIAVSPSDSRIVLIGAATGGIWRSNDGGNSFTPVSDDQVDLAVGSISFARSNPSTVYAGMGDPTQGYLGSGVLKSMDGGSSWSRVSNSTLPAPGSISKIEVDPSDANRVYAAQYSKQTGNVAVSGGVYVSTDGGVSWSKKLGGAARDLVVDPGNQRNLYAGISTIDPAADPPLGLYRSTDRGVTWSNVFNGPVYNTTQRRDIRVAISPADSQRIFVYMGGTVGPSLDVRFA